MSAVGLLLEGNVAIERGDCIEVVLSEHSEVSYNLGAGLDPAIVGDIYEMFEAPPIKRLVQSRLAVLRTGEYELQLSSKQFVGFASASMQGRQVLVKVLPKINSVRFIELAIAADLLPSWKDEITVGQGFEISVIEWLIGALLQAINELVSHGGLRSTHEKHREELKNKVKGRLLIAPFTRNLSRGKFQALPCSFALLKLDNDVNRFIRWGLHCALEAVSPFAELSNMSAQLRTLDALFANVSVRRPPHHMIYGQLRLPPNMRHYERSVRIVQALLRNLSIDGLPGDFRGASVALNMNDVYEKAFYSYLKQYNKEALRKAGWALSLKQEGMEDQEVNMFPDIFIPPDETGRAYILDTKWKTQRSDVDEDLASTLSRSLRVHSADLYQAIAYASHFVAKVDPTCRSVTVGLVYPTFGSSRPLGLTVEVGNVLMKIVVVGWNMIPPHDISVPQVLSDLGNASPP